MVTRESVEIAREYWEQAKVGYALSLANWGLLKENRSSIIESLVSQGFSFQAASVEFTRFYEAHQEENRKLLAAMTERQAAYAELDQIYRSQEPKGL